MRCTKHADELWYGVTTPRWRAGLEDYTAYRKLDVVTIVDDLRNYFIESNYTKTLSVQQV